MSQAGVFCTRSWSAELSRPSQAEASDSRRKDDKDADSWPRLQPVQSVVPEKECWAVPRSAAHPNSEQPGAVNDAGGEELTVCRQPDLEIMHQSKDICKSILQCTVSQDF